MHIAVFCQYYHTPDCAASARPYALVECLARRHDVTLITTRTWHRQRITEDFDWVPAGVRLHMLDVPYANAMGGRARLGAYTRYAAKALWRGASLPAPDLVYGSSTPLTAAAAAAAAARWHGVPWVFEVRDLWPAFPIQAGGLSNPLLQKAARTLEKRLYRSAAHVVTLSEDMEAHVRRRCPEVRGLTTIEYGTDRDLLARAEAVDAAALRRAYDFDDCRVVLYAGSFGRANDIPTLLQAAARLRSRRDVRFVFAGHGYHTADIRAAAEALPNVRLLPPLPLLRALALFRVADVAVVPFANLPVLSVNSPAKLFDSLAAGTPVVVTNPGWTKRLVETHGCGWYVPAERADALAGRLAHVLDHPAERAAAGERAAALARSRFARSALMDRLLAVVEAAAQPAAQPAPSGDGSPSARNGRAASLPVTLSERTA